jgi:mannose-1-phosphate guanylyltransferase
LSRVRTAFVLGAGLGTRLRPLTDCRPKPLIPIFNKPLITFALDHLIAAGIERFVINTHHLAEQFDAAFASGEYRGRLVQLVFEPELLETGGGIKNAEPFLGREPFLVYSGDILTDIDLGALIDAHFRDGNEVTLGLRDTGLASGVTLDGARVTDFRGRLGAPGTRHDFANVSVWNAGIYDRIAAGAKVGFIPVLAEWLAEGLPLGGVLLDEREWFNVGSRGEYLAVHRFIRERSWRPEHVVDPDWPEAPIGKNCRIGDDVVLEDTIVWDDAEIASGSRLRGCIVRDRCVVSGTHADTDF